MTFRTPRFIAASAATGIAVMTAGAVALAAENSPPPKSAASIPGFPGGINNHKLVACMQAQHTCNPQASSWKQLHALDVSKPPSRNAHLMTSQAAASEARDMFHGASNSAAGSALMTGRAFQRQFHVDRNLYINENRLIWVVTVKTRVRTDGGPARRGKVFDQASVIIDAASGAVTDACIGCAWVQVK